MNIAAVVAGGFGTRMGDTMPKQFLPLCGRPIIFYCLSAFLEYKDIDFVIVGVNPDYISLVERYKSLYFHNTPRIIITAGGTDRNETLMNILHTARKTVQADENTVIVSHDAARPFISKKMIDDVIKGLSCCDTACASVPSVDTTVITKNGNIAAFPRRSDVLLVQTPQSFRLGAFEDACSLLTRNQLMEATDISSLFFMCGKTVKFTAGSENNIKITYPRDLAIAETILRNNQ